MHMVVGRIQFLASCSEGQSLIVGQRTGSLSFMPCVPLHRASPDTATEFVREAKRKSESAKKVENAKRQKVQSFVT